jgi:hypothetical protein
LLVLVFAEGADKKKANGVDRYSLKPSDELAVYTIPPGPAEFEMILKKVKPKKVYLIGQGPLTETTDEFLTRLAGMAKFAISKRSGKTSIPALAAATAQRELTIRIGLEWLAAWGHITILGEEDAITLSTGKGEGNEYSQKELYMAVKGLLEETGAYRSFVATTKDPVSLFNS